METFAHAVDIRSVGVIYSGSLRDEAEYTVFYCANMRLYLKFYL
jgi:hypothetical protein